MVDLQAHALTLLVHRCGWLALIALVTLLTALLALAFPPLPQGRRVCSPRLVSYSRAAVVHPRRAARLSFAATSR